MSTFVPFVLRPFTAYLHVIYSPSLSLPYIYLITLQIIINIYRHFFPFIPILDLSPSELSSSSYVNGVPTLHLVAYSVNQKGRSEPTMLEDIAINEAEKRTGTSVVFGVFQHFFFYFFVFCSSLFSPSFVWSCFLLPCCWSIRTQWQTRRFVTIETFHCHLFRLICVSIVCVLTCNPPFLAWRYLPKRTMIRRLAENFSLLHCFTFALLANARPTLQSVSACWRRDKIRRNASDITSKFVGLKWFDENVVRTHETLYLHCW